MKKPSRPHSCNLVRDEQGALRLWAFVTGGTRVELLADKTVPAPDPLPQKLVGKTWRSLVRPRVNIAWLPPGQVFLRVLHLPTSEPAEVAPMIEFQIEKLSPLPLSQMVWSFEILPHGPENALTVVVAFAARHSVETFLGAIEARGYQPDRLDLAVLPELMTAPEQGDGLYLHPRETAEGFECMAAWWRGGVLRDLVMSRLPKDNSARALLDDQVAIMTWTGELQGWADGAPVLRVMASESTAVAFKAATGLGADVETLAPESAVRLAERAVADAAEGSARLNLLPPERAVRYRQQLIDRTWMRGLGALVVAYVIGVVLYLAGVEFARFQRSGAEEKLRVAGEPYTNALQLRAKVDVLQEQLNLKFAALDAMDIVSRHLPGDLRLTSFSFSRGKSVTLFGEGPINSIAALTEYNRKLVNATGGTNAGPFFADVRPPSSSTRAGQGGGEVLSWSFSAEIRGTAP